MAGEHRKRQTMRTHLQTPVYDCLNRLSLGTMSASGYIENLAKSATCLINSQALTRLTSIWKDRGVTMETKVKLVKVLVFPIVLYGAEQHNDTSTDR